MDLEARIDHLSGLLDEREPGLRSSVAISRELRLLEKRLAVERGEPDDEDDPREVRWSDPSDPLRGLDEPPPKGWKALP